jgi:hypothetical protein
MCEFTRQEFIDGLQSIGWVLFAVIIVQYAIIQNSFKLHM